MDNNIEVLKLLVGSLAAIVGLFTFVANRKTPYGRERYEKVLVPIFELIEPSLMVKEKDLTYSMFPRKQAVSIKKVFSFFDAARKGEKVIINRRTMLAIQLILKKQSKLAGGYLRRYSILLDERKKFKTENDEISQKYLLAICQYICSEHNKMGRKLGIPGKSLGYRATLYKPSFSWRPLLVSTLLSILVFVVATLTAALILIFLEILFEWNVGWVIRFAAATLISIVCIYVGKRWLN